MSKKFKLSNAEVSALIKGASVDFPKYTTQLMNLANQNAQGTRPKVVGQMSELIQEFEGRTLGEWEAWYKQWHPGAIDQATERIYGMIDNLRSAMDKVDRNLVRSWVEDLVILKTYTGLRFQEAILKKVAELKGMSCRFATPDEESKGIDGYIGYIPVSVKPLSYKTKSALAEEISVQMIFYEKKKDGIVMYFDL